MPECTSDVICATTTTTTGSDTSTSTSTEDGLAGTADSAAVGNAALSLEAENAANAAFDSLVGRVELVGEPVELDASGLEGSLNAVAAAVVVIGMITALLVIGVKNWKAGWRIPGRFTRFALVSLFAVGAGLGLWEITTTVSGELVHIPADGGVTGDLWSAPFASLTLPAVEILLDAQPFIVAMLLASLPVAAAISMFSAYDRLVWIVAALAVANIVWLPFFVLLVNQLLAVDQAAHAGWWAFAACVVVAATNSLAIAATRSKDYNHDRH